MLIPGNTILDFESAPVPSSTIPNHGIEPVTKKEEKDAMAVVNSNPNGGDVTISAAAGYNSPHDDEIEPTEEEYETLRK